MIIELILKNYKVSLIILLVALLFIGTSLNLDSLVVSLGMIMSIGVYIYITRSALRNLGDCLMYLGLIAPILGMFIGFYIDKSHYLPQFTLSDYVYYSVAYFVIWLLVAMFAKIEVVKLATLIIAQILTAIFLLGTVVMNMVPIQYFNDFVIASGADLKELETIMGYNSRGLVETMMQILLYPALFNALIIYAFTEVRSYYKSKENYKEIPIKKYYA